MTAANATGWIPSKDGNCIEIVPGDAHVATATFTAADGSTTQVLVPQ
jgi:hypothetical protein